MGLGAALAGGAEGVMGGWDDNREKIKAEAEQAFKLKLEQSRIDMAKTARDQAATDLMNPQSPTGMLAQRKKDEAIQNAEMEAVNADSLRQAEWAREDENKRLDREGTLAAAKAKAGDTGKMPPKVKAAFDMATAIRGQEVISDQDAKLLAGYDKIVQDYAGMKLPVKKTRQELLADVAKNLDNQEAMSQLKAQFGDKAAAIIKEARALNGDSNTKAEVVDTSATGILGRHTVETQRAQAATRKAKQDTLRKEKATSKAESYIEKIKQGGSGGTAAFLQKGIGGYMAESDAEKAKRLARIADDPDVDKKTREEAKRMLEVATGAKFSQ